MNDSSHALTSDRANSRASRRIAVIGAGISGLTCARILADQGMEVTVFEKSRGVGGRMSTRRAADSMQFDHGAQYFTVRDPRFRDFVDAWLRDDVVSRWQSRIVSLESGTVKAEKASSERFVATPRMSAICKRLAVGIDVRLECEVAPPLRVGKQWRLSNGAEDLGEFDYVIISAPPAQSSRLLEAAPTLAMAVSKVAMQPCWALMVALQQPTGLDYSGAFVQNSPLSWIARDSDKPGRCQGAETWVIHASGDWSSRHIEDSPDQIGPLLLHAFWNATDLQSRPWEHLSVHRWRYALPPEPLKATCLFDADLKIGACGDWCDGPRVEGACLSGLTVAEKLLSLESE